MTPSTKDENSLYSIDALVEDFIVDESLTHHEYYRLQNWALRGLRELSLDVIQKQPRTVKLEMNSKRQVRLPDDYVDWSKVAILVENRLRTIGVKDDIVVEKVSNTENKILEGPEDNWPAGTNFANYGGYHFYNYNGSAIFSFGIGLMDKVGFKVYDNEYPKTIQFNSELSPQSIYLEYITDGINLCGETHVHPYVAEYIMAYMAYNYEKRRPGKTEASIYRTGQELYYAEKKVRARTSDLDYKSFLNLTRKYYKMTPNY